MAGKISVELDPLSLDANKIYERLEAIGLDFADKKAAYYLLDDMTATFRATASNASQSDTVSQRRTDAECSEVYVAHLKEKAAARRAYERAKARKESVFAWVELIRSQAATERAKMSML